MRKSLILLSGLCAFLVCLLVSGLVYAQGGDVAATPSLATQVSELAFDIITPVLVLFVMWGARKLILVFEAKTKIDIPDKQEQMIWAWIDMGIHRLEEASRNKVKGKTDKLKGPEKLEGTGDFVMAMIAKNGWDDWARDKIVDMIEAKIGHHRANGGKPTLDEGEVA